MAVGAAQGLQSALCSHWAGSWAADWRAADPVALQNSSGAAPRLQVLEMPWWLAAAALAPSCPSAHPL